MLMFLFSYVSESAVEFWAPPYVDAFLMWPIVLNSAVIKVNAADIFFSGTELVLFECKTEGTNCSSQNTQGLWLGFRFRTSWKWISVGILRYHRLSEAIDILSFASV